MVLPVPPFWERTVIVARAGGEHRPWLYSFAFVSASCAPSRKAAQTGGETRLQASRGLYDPSYEHDACGVAFVARLRAPASHEVVARALHALERLEHRGAEGADPDTGDGAGILIQLPDAFLRAEAGFELPSPAATAWPSASCRRGNPAEAMRLLEERVEAEGQQVLGWREVPVDEGACGTRRAPSRRASRSCSWAPATTWPTRTPSSASST